MKKTAIRIVVSLGIITAAGFLTQNITQSKDTPERQTIAYVVDGNLFTLDSNSRGNKQVTSTGDVLTIFDQRKDGTVLLGKNLDTSRNTDTTFSTELWRIQPNGRRQQLVAGNVMEAKLVPHSADILYGTDEHDVFRLSPDGRQEKITTKAARISVSPDGQHVAYLKLNPDWQRGDYGDKARGLFVFKLQTKVEKQLTSSWTDFDPSWSPDGKTISFASGRTGLASIWMMDADGSDIRQITNVGQVDYDPSQTLTAPNHPVLWTADNQHLVYEADRKIWKVTLDAQKTRIQEAKHLAFGEQPTILGGNIVGVLAVPANTLGPKVIKVDLRGNLVQ